jgi:hypothetical protein
MSGHPVSFSSVLIVVRKNEMVIPAEEVFQPVLAEPCPMPLVEGSIATAAEKRA